MTVSSRKRIVRDFFARESFERENFYFGLGVPRGVVESIGNHFARLAGNFALNAREYAWKKHLPFPIPNKSESNFFPSAFQLSKIERVKIWDGYLRSTISLAIG